MNIEQEFKELHELLLACYDEDYEENLDKALGKLNTLKEAITVTRCCETLKTKETMTFEDWRKDNCTHLEGDLYSFKHNVFDSYDLRYVYMRECKQSL